MSEVFGFDRSGMERVTSAVRTVEALPADEPTRTPTRRNPIPPAVRFLRCDSVTATNSRYPATWLTRNAVAQTWADGGDAWLEFPNGDTPVVDDYYPAILQGQTAEGVAIYTALDSAVSSSGSTVAIVAVTSSTAAATPGSYAHYSCNILSTDGNTFTSVTAARVMFPNNEVPAVANYGALYTGTTSGGVPLYVALYLPMQVQATDAGTGDSDATVYGITHLHFNQGSGLAVSYPATYKVKVAAADASKTHAGVINLTTDQVLGDGDKKFSDKLTVNEDQGTGVKFHVRKNTGATPALEVTANGTVRINTTATTYTIEVAGDGHLTTNLQVDLDITAGDDITATDTITGAIINATTKFQANGIDGTGSDYVDGINTTIDFTGGIATSVT